MHHEKQVFPFKFENLYIKKLKLKNLDGSGVYAYLVV
jgi:hypothetical protein